MRNVNPAPFFLLICLVFVINHAQQGILAIKEDANTNLYIVYLGEKQHDDPKNTEDSHHEMLASVVGSKELASELMVYNYKHGFSGFAAKLTKSQAKQIAELPSVIQVIPNRQHKLHTTRSYDYMGLSLGSYTPSNLLKKVNGGDGIIIGVIDSGINPESRSFHDKGLGPIPPKWKGFCESSPTFDATRHCNKKLIGARTFVEGAIESMKSQNDGTIFNMTEFETFNTRSPVDTDGHGTHVSGIAAGSYVTGASFLGTDIASGTLRGGAPKARVAVYKVCWNDVDNKVRCGDADILRACDQAIYDGVDVLQISIGKELPNESEIRESTFGASIGTYHAVAHGIPAVLSGGNDGPKAQSVTNVSPWMITVGASTMDRDFSVTITLGNNLTLPGSSLYLGNLTGEFIGLVYANVPCQDLLANSTEGYEGKVVLCFSRPIMEVDLSHVFSVVEGANAAGVIVAEMPNDYDLDAYEIPCAFVDYEAGSKLLFYIQSNGSPMVKFGHIETIIGDSVLTRVAHFSSRGPNSFAPAILKPDITAPGVKILAAYVKPGPTDPNYFSFLCGTSMAAPHVSGIVALLRASHPDWSPAAIKSALMTTAWNYDQFGYPIFAMGSSLKPADPFDMGAGLVNPNGADDPGLVYDMGQADYIYYLCAIGYTIPDISRVAQKSIRCPTEKPSLLDLNLPSITIPSLPNSTVTLTRTVINVGPVNSAYKSIVTTPTGTTVSVTPNVLVFNSNKNIISFKVTVSAVKEVSRGYNFGSLTWTDGVHAVRSPISVRV